MPLRPSVWHALLCGSCASVSPSATFEPVQDLCTTEPRSLAEGGYGDPVVLPAGISFSTRLCGYEELDGTEPPHKRFELSLTLVDARAPAAGRRVDPLLDGVVLVDDEGAQFPCGRASVPASRAQGSTAAADAAAEGAGAVPRRHDYTLVFELPQSYRFRSVLAVTVHWALSLDGGEGVRISSRFRV